MNRIIQEDTTRSAPTAASAHKLNGAGTYHTNPCTRGWSQRTRVRAINPQISVKGMQTRP